MQPLPEVESKRFVAATSVCAIRIDRISLVGACRGWPSIESAIVAAGASRAGGQAGNEREYERRLDFPACDPAAADRHDLCAGSDTLQTVLGSFFLWNAEHVKVPPAH